MEMGMFDEKVWTEYLGDGADATIYEDGFGRFVLYETPSFGGEEIFVGKFVDLESAKEAISRLT